MTGLLLATLLNLAPGVRLADNVEARNVALSEARLRIQFASDEEAAVAPAPNLDAMTREQLAAELRRLDESRPSLVGPIVLLGIGVPLAIVGVVLSGYGVVFTILASSSSSVGAVPAIVGIVVAGVGVVMLAAGVTLAIVGGVMLGKRLGQRRAVGVEIDSVQQRLDGLGHPAPLPAGPEGLPPPPPPPPPQANLVVPGPLQTVLIF